MSVFLAIFFAGLFIVCASLASELVIFHRPIAPLYDDKDLAGSDWQDLYSEMTKPKPHALPASVQAFWDFIELTYSRRIYIYATRSTCGRVHVVAKQGIDLVEIGREIFDLTTWHVDTLARWPSARLVQDICDTVGNERPTVRA